MNTNRMMKTIALTAILTVSAISMAQHGGQGGAQAGRQGGPGMGGPQMMPGGLLILHMKTVQKELNITAAQDKAIDELTLKQGRRGGPGGQGGPGGPGGPPPTEGEQGGRGQGQRRDGRPGEIEGLDKILNARQLARHKQLTLQWDAPMAFLRPEVADNLKITENQRTAIDEVIRRLMPPMGGGGPGRPRGGFGEPGLSAPEGGQGRQRGQGGPGAAPPNFSEMLSKKKQATTQVMTHLTEAQKRSWSVMTGTWFDTWVQPEPPRPEGGQGGPRMSPPPGF